MQMTKFVVVSMTILALSAPAFAQDDAMSEDSMGAMSDDSMGSMMMMEGGKVVAIMPDGHMGTMMMDTDKMNSTINMSSPLQDCVMFIVGADGATYQVDTSSEMGRNECEQIAL